MYNSVFFFSRVEKFVHLVLVNFFKFFLLNNKIKDLRNAIGLLSGHAKKFCTNACLKRYLEARNWNLEKAKKMLEETLKWRSNFKPEEIRWVLNQIYMFVDSLCV